MLHDWEIPRPRRMGAIAMATLRKGEWSSRASTVAVSSQSASANRPATVGGARGGIVGE